MKPNLIFLILLMLHLFVSCKKKGIQFQYPEDPSTTTLTPRERLTGSWRIYNYEFNGNNIIANMDTVNNGKEKIEEMAISYSYDLSYEKWLFRMYNKYCNFQSETAFNTEEPYYITINGSANQYLAKWLITPFKHDPKKTSIEAKWFISKLYDTDLNLILKTDSGDYKMYFKKQ